MKDLQILKDFKSVGKKAKGKVAKNQAISFITLLNQNYKNDEKVLQKTPATTQNKTNFKIVELKTSEKILANEEKNKPIIDKKINLASLLDMANDLEAKKQGKKDEKSFDYKIKIDEKALQIDEKMPKIDEKSAFFKPNLKAKSKIKNKELDYKNTLLNDLNFTQILDFLEHLQVDKKNVQLASFFQAPKINYDAIKKDLQNCEHIQELVKIAKKYELNIKKITIDKIENEVDTKPDFRLEFPNLVSAEFFTPIKDLGEKKQISVLSSLIKNSEKNELESVKNQINSLPKSEKLGELLQKIDEINLKSEPKILQKNESEKSSENQKTNEFVIEKNKTNENFSDFAKASKSEKNAVEQKQNPQKSEINLQNAPQEEQKNVNFVNEKSANFVSEKNKFDVLKSGGLNEILAKIGSSEKVGEKTSESTREKTSEKVGEKIAKTLEKNASNFANNEIKNLQTKPQELNKISEKENAKLDEKIDEKMDEKITEKIDEKGSLNQDDKMQKLTQKVDISHIKKPIQRAAVDNFFDKFQEEIKNYKAPARRIKIDLNPKELGEIKVEMISRGNSLQVTFHSANASTQALFASNQMEFRNNLLGMGFTQLNMNFGDKKEQNEQQKEQKERSKRQNKDEESESEILLDAKLVRYA